MKKLTYLACLLALGLFITGCGSGDDASTGEGAVNTGAGAEDGDGGDGADDDAGVGTDPELMSKGVN
ncbi:MAG: hypothetical protein ABGZ53_34110 [Fuerstiella sp.]